MSNGASFNRGKSKQVVATPPRFVRAVEYKLKERFTWDLAATHENFKAPNYFSKGENSFLQKWHKLKGLLWLNPEYDDIESWAAKSFIESCQGARIVMLVPASVGSNWFRDYIHEKTRTIFVNGRIVFLGSTQGYPKDLILACFGFRPGFEIWTPHKSQLK